MNGPIKAIVYRFFADDSQLLYVGMTAVGPVRWVAHAVHQPWWAQVATVRVAHFDTIEAALVAERDAIATQHPAYNRILVVPRLPRSYTNRRGWSNGSVYQRQDGRWCAAVRRDGQRFVRYAKSRVEADLKLVELRTAAT